MHSYCLRFLERNQNIRVFLKVLPICLQHHLKFKVDQIMEGSSHYSGSCKPIFCCQDKEQPSRREEMFALPSQLPFVWHAHHNPNIPTTQRGEVLLLG